MTLVQPELADSLVLPVEGKKEMLSVREEGGQTVVRINSSSLSILQECPRKALYTLREGWRAVSESPATCFGRAVHAALEVFYSAPAAERERVTPALIQEMELLAFGHPSANLTSSLILRATAAFIEIAKPLASLPDGDKRSVLNGVWILSEYFKAYYDDPYVAYRDATGPFIERDFTYCIYATFGLKIELFGRIDFAFEHAKTGEIIVGDHKTSSSLSFQDQSYFDRDKPNHQYTGYVLGAQQVYGIRSGDFLVNVVEVKAKPKTPRGKGVSFPRQITKRTNEDFEELTNTIVWFVRSHLEMIDRDMWPQGGVDACNKYGSCMYKPVCSAPKNMRETLLNNKFTRG